MVKSSRNPQAVALSQEELGGDPQSPPNSFIQLLIKCLCRTGGDLDQNTELQSLIKKVEGESPKEVFFKVAKGMFADGKFNWGRVTAFFYFASKLAVKALCKNIPQVVKNIMGCAMEFLRSRLLGWIKDKGGWVPRLLWHQQQENRSRRRWQSPHWSPHRLYRSHHRSPHQSRHWSCHRSRHHRRHRSRHWSPHRSPHRSLHRQEDVVVGLGVWVFLGGPPAGMVLTHPPPLLPHLLCLPGGLGTIIVLGICR
uniref:Bcl-2 Bcl-2 homology region 1-3 domain-containing protein n=1 Tax=Calidris pygmaea TaxID=425635 RepID=A0A8C3K3A8_9CHAR